MNFDEFDAQFSMRKHILPLTEVVGYGWRSLIAARQRFDGFHIYIVDSGCVTPISMIRRYGTSEV